MHAIAIATTRLTLTTLGMPLVRRTRDRRARTAGLVAALCLAGLPVAVGGTTIASAGGNTPTGHIAPAAHPVAVAIPPAQRIAALARQARAVMHGIHAPAPAAGRPALPPAAFRPGSALTIHPRDAALRPAPRITPAQVPLTTRPRVIWRRHATARHAEKPLISCPSNVWEGLPYLNRYDNYSDNGSGVCVVSSTSIHDSTFTSLTLVTTSTNYMEANVTVNNLTIPAGATVQAGTGSYASYGLYITGSINANGTSSQPIVLTSYYTSPGQWGGISFRPGSTGNMTYVHISYAGNGYLRNSHGNGYSTEVLIEGAGPTISNSTIDTSGYVGVEVIGGGVPTLTNDTITSNYYHGLYVTGGSAPSILNSTISNNNYYGGGDGIYIDGGSTPTISGDQISGNQNDGIEVTGLNTNPSLSNDTISGNNNYALNYDLPTVANMTIGNAGLSISGNGHDAIGVNGTLSGALTVQNAGVPVRSDNLTIDINGQYTVNDGATVQLGGVTVDGTMSMSSTVSGITVQFPDYYNNIAVNGVLSMLGTAAAPIVVASGQSSPYPGQWGGISFRPGSVGTMSYVHMSDGGDGYTYDSHGNGYSTEVLIEGAGPTISNSTIDTSGYVGVEVIGGGVPTLTNDTITSNYYHGLYVTGGSAPSILNSTISNNNYYGGGDGIYVDGGSTPTISGDQISGNQNDGIEVTGLNTNPSLSNDTISGNNNYALNYDLPTVPNLTLGSGSGLTLSGNGHDAIGVNGTLSGALTVQNAGVPVRSDNLTVNAGGQFSVSDGVTVQLGSVTINGTMSMSSTVSGITVQFPDYYSNIAVNGVLSMLGTAAAPIVVASGQSSPYPGQWGGISFRPGSVGTMSYVHMSDGGDGYTYDSHGNGYSTEVLIEGAGPTISNSTIDTSSYYGVEVIAGGVPTLSNDTITSNYYHGLYVTGGSAPSILNSTISNNNYYGGGDGIYVDGGSTPTISGDQISGNQNDGIEVTGLNTNPSLSNDTISGNNNYALNYDLPTAASMTVGGSPGLSISGNGTNAIGVNGDLTGTLTIQGSAVPVRSSSLTVDTTGQYIAGGGTTLQLGNITDKGTMSISGTTPITVQFPGYNNSLIVNGTLNMIGTPTAPISVSSGQSPPYSGQWAGISFMPGSSGTLANLHISAAGGCCQYDSHGGYHYTSILIDGVNPSITNMIVDNSGGNDVEVVDGGQPHLNNDAFAAVPCCGYDGVLNDNGSAGPTVDATNDYWYSANGPSGSGPGTGTPVSPGVNFTPWLVAPPGPPQIILNPTSGSYRTAISVTGGNFGAGEAVKVYWDSTSTPPLTTTTTTATKSFSVTISAPQAITGTHTVIAVGQSSHLSARAAFTVIPSASLLHSSGAQGSQNVLSGYGFGSKEVVKAYWSRPGGPLLGSATTTSLGTFAGASAITFTVPLSPTGTYRVYAVGQTSHALVSALFRITPALAVSPSSGAHGSSVTITGTGYAAHENVIVKWNCATSTCSSTTVLGVATADGNGDFSGLHGATPSSASIGTYPIGGLGETSGAFASTTFSVTS